MQADREERSFDEMDIDEKIAHVHRLQQRIEEELSRTPCDDAHVAEAERRLDEYERNPEGTVSWEELKFRLWGSKP